MKALKKCIIAGIILVVIGAVILVVTLAVNGWKIKDDNYTMKTFTAQNDYTEIDIDIDANRLKTEFYDGEKIEIYYPDGSGFKTSINERNGRLRLEMKVKWYATIFKSSSVPETVVKLPRDKIIDIKVDLCAGTVVLDEGEYGNLDINVSAGTLNARDITCVKMDCDVSAGKIDFANLSCPEIKADVSAGSLKININGAKSEYTIRSSVSVGSCNVSDQTGTTYKTLAVDCSAGSVNVSFSNNN